MIAASSSLPTLEVRNVRLRGAPELVTLVAVNGRFVDPAEVAAPATTVIDAEGRVALPGLVESHLHLDKCHLPIRADDLASAIRLTTERKGTFTRDDIADRARRLLDDAVVNGTTAIRAHTDVDPIVGLLGVETLVGLRDEYVDLVDLQIVAFPQDGIHHLDGVEGLLRAALEAGADVLGACPYTEPTPVDARRHVRTVFALATEHGVPLDLHVDFSDDIADERFVLAGEIAREAARQGIAPTLGHATSLGSLPAPARAEAIAALRDAGAAVVVLPHTDLHLGGRRDEGPIRRGLAPVRELLAAGVTVACSSNNVRNAFTPYGNAAPLETALFLAQTAQLASPAELDAVLDAVTVGAARAIGIADGYGLAPGDRAELVILDSSDAVDALLDRAAPRWVVKRGRIVAETRMERTIVRPVPAVAVVTDAPPRPFDAPLS